MTAFLTSKRNGQLAAQMEDARECLADLARRGAQILALEIGSIRVPRITLAQPPAVSPAAPSASRAAPAAASKPTPPGTWNARSNGGSKHERKRQIDCRT